MHAKRPRIRILVVDDDESQRLGLARYLQNSGCEVVTAGNYEDAIVAAKNCSPHIAVCDWQLGSNRDGVDIARNLQKNFGTRVVFLSGLSTDELRSATTDIRVLRYFKKPTDPRKVAGVIMAAL